MAYRRSITTRAKLLYEQRIGPSFSYIYHDDDRGKDRSTAGESRIREFIQQRSFGSSVNSSTGFGALFRELRCSQFIVPMTGGLVMRRQMSTAVGEGAEKIEFMPDVAGVLVDKTVEAVASQAQAVNEVAIAAADSFVPVAALQYLIDYVHCFTGFNWWASIVVTSLLIRCLTVPLMINQLKSTSKLTLMRPRLEEIKQEMQDRGMSPTAVAEGQQRMQQIFREYGVTPWTPLKGLLFQGPVFVSFFLAIQNMVEKVPSFKEGGIFWFTDLTTPDSMYIFPVLTALTFWITVECNMQEGLEGNPAAGTMKKVSRVFAALSIPLTMGFPKAIFCYWITSNMFSLMYGLVIKKPEVKKLLRIPIILVSPPTTTAESKPAFSFSEALKKYAAAMKHQHQQQLSQSSPVEESTPVTQRIPSSSVLNQRIRNLEKEVKGRKKGKKK